MLSYDLWQRAVLQAVSIHLPDYWVMETWKPKRIGGNHTSATVKETYPVHLKHTQTRVNSWFSCNNVIYVQNLCHINLIYGTNYCEATSTCHWNLQVYIPGWKRYEYRGWNIFQKSISQLKILGNRNVTLSKFHADGPEFLIDLLTDTHFWFFLGGRGGNWLCWKISAAPVSWATRNPVCRPNASLDWTTPSLPF
jgi:hypothetical protein